MSIRRRGLLTRELSVAELEEGDSLELPPRDPVVVKTDDSYTCVYKNLEELGKGKFGVVYKARRKADSKIYAAKFVRKSAASKKEVLREIEMMNLLHHKRLIQLFDAYETKQDMIVIMELVTGGELFEKVVEEDNLTEKQVIRYMKQVLYGVQHMHRKHMVHLDLKPENILCLGGGTPGYEEIKLIDFGMTRVLVAGKEETAMCGTPEFVAPEVITFNPITLAADMWSLGVITYVLLSGLSPFMGDDDSETLKNVASGEYDFEDEDEIFENLSDEVKLFIEDLLILDPKKRLTVDECLEHSWLRNEGSDRRINTSNLKKFIARRRWQRTMNTIKAVSRLAGGLSLFGNKTTGAHGAGKGNFLANVKAQQAKEDEEGKKLAEEARKQKEREEAEKQRKEAEAAEKKRKEAEAAEKKRKEAEKAEKKRKEAEAAEKKRKEAEAAEKKRKEAEEAEKKRKEAEEAEKKRKEAEEAEQKRKEVEAAEKKRKEAEEAEKKQKEAEAAEKKRIEAEATEKKRKEAEEAEKKRKEAEAAEKKRKEAEEAEKKRNEAEAAETKRKEAEEAEQKRKEVEAAEKKRKEAEAAEKKRKEAEEAEKKRKEAEAAEKKRKEAEEAEKKRKETEEAEKKKVAEATSKDKKEDKKEEKKLKRRDSKKIKKDEKAEKKRKEEEEKKRKEQEKAEKKRLKEEEKAGKKKEKESKKMNEEERKRLREEERKKRQDGRNQGDNNNADEITISINVAEESSKEGKKPRKIILKPGKQIKINGYSGIVRDKAPSPKVSPKLTKKEAECTEGGVANKAAVFQTETK